MTIDDSDNNHRTIETRLSHPDLYPLIEQLLFFFATIRHSLWRDLIIKGLSLTALKKCYIAKYGVTARHFNSLAKEVSTKKTAIIESKKEERSSLESAIAVLSRDILKLTKKIPKIKSLLKAIESYREKIKTWKQRKPKIRATKKPKMPLNIKGQFTARLVAEIKNSAFILHQKKRRLDSLMQKLEALKNRESPAVCFGTKKLFNAQHHLEQNGLIDHGEWLEKFRLKRSSQMSFIGSSDESAGNQTVQFDPVKKTLRIRLPNSPAFSGCGTHLILESIDFPEHLREELLYALSHPGPEAKKNQKTRLPISYRLVRRINENTCRSWH